MWGILVGVGLLDLLFGPFVLAGWEQASLTPGISPGFSLDQIDWSHSLLMSVVWSGLYAVAFLRSGRQIAGVMGLAAFSHFLLDLPMHPPDMGLWPGSDVHLGLGLWRVLPQGGGSSSWRSLGSRAPITFGEPEALLPSAVAPSRL